MGATGLLNKRSPRGTSGLGRKKAVENKYGGWIKCSDRLPDDAVDVLTLNVDGKMVVERGPKWIRNGGGNALARGVAKAVTYWMPLPEPPKVSKKRKVALEIECEDEVCGNCRVRDGSYCYAFKNQLAWFSKDIECLRCSDCLAAEIKEAGMAEKCDRCGETEGIGRYTMSRAQKGDPQGSVLYQVWLCIACLKACLEAKDEGD